MGKLCPVPAGNGLLHGGQLGAVILHLEVKNFGEDGSIGQTVGAQPLQPVRFVVDMLLSQGLHILAGSPSWVSSGWR